MKTNILLLAVLFSMAIFFINCKTESQTTKETAESSTTEVIYPRVINTTIPTSCLITENRNGLEVTRINAVCADTLIRNYQTQVNTIISQNQNIPNIDDLLSYGAKVDISSLTAIMNTIDSLGFDEVYTMMAAVPGKRSSVIFVLKNKETNHKAFYNFTQPCPDACPGTVN